MPTAKSQIGDFEMKKWACQCITAIAVTCSVLPLQAQTSPVHVQWLGQSAFKITSPAGKVIITDPWLKANPLTPPEFKTLENLGKVDVLLVTHGHLDHFADAPALAKLNNVPMYAPGDICLLYTSPSPRDRQKSRMPSSA